MARDHSRIQSHVCYHGRRRLVLLGVGSRLPFGTRVVSRTTGAVPSGRVALSLDWGQADGPRRPRGVVGNGSALSAASAGRSLSAIR